MPFRDIEDNVYTYTAFRYVFSLFISGILLILSLVFMILNFIYKVKHAKKGILLCSYIEILLFIYQSIILTFGDKVEILCSEQYRKAYYKCQGTEPPKIFSIIDKFI